MNKKLFLICCMTTATIFSRDIDRTTPSQVTIDPKAAHKLLSILKPINENYQKVSETMKDSKIDIYNFNGMLAISLLSAYLGLGRWACATAATLILMNLESLIHMIEKDLENLENNNKEQQKS